MLRAQPLAESVVVVEFGVPALVLRTLHGVLVHGTMAFGEFRRQTAGQIAVLVPLGLHLLHQALHALQIPAFAVFGFGQQAEDPGVEHHPAELGDAVRVGVTAGIGRFCLLDGPGGFEGSTGRQTLLPAAQAAQRCR